MDRIGRREGSKEESSREPWDQRVRPLPRSQRLAGVGKEDGNGKWRGGDYQARCWKLGLWLSSYWNERVNARTMMGEAEVGHRINSLGVGLGCRGAKNGFCLFSFDEPSPGPLVGASLIMNLFYL